MRCTHWAQESGEKDFTVTEKSLETFYSFQEPLWDTTFKITPKTSHLLPGYVAKTVSYRKRTNKCHAKIKALCLSNKSCQSNVRKCMGTLLYVYARAGMRAHPCTRTTCYYTEASDDLLIPCLLMTQCPIFLF